MAGQTRQTREESLQGAIDWLGSAAESLRGWFEAVRDEQGLGGRWRWSLETTRPANVFATQNILGGMRVTGNLDLITDADRRGLGEWIESMRTGDGQYRDPAILGRRPPNWPEDQEYPTPGLIASVSGKAFACLCQMGLAERDQNAPEPPAGMPQAHEPEKALEFIRTRPLDTQPWAAGSHAMGMTRRLLDWHLEGKMDIDWFRRAAEYLYSKQDPQTGLWGNPDVPRFQRINGAFKLFRLFCGELNLPVPLADRIVDQVLLEFDKPGYDDSVGGCDEWDNWYVLAHAADWTDHRAEDVREMAIRRLNRYHIFQKPDGGFSYWATRCQASCVGVDMAPPIPQGDAMSPALYGASAAVCIDLLGIDDHVEGWSAQWDMNPRDESVRRLVRETLNIEG